MDERMILVTGVYPVGGHLAGWRHPSAYPDIVMNLDAMIDVSPRSTTSAAAGRSGTS
jgi:hypothetical protein